MFLCCGTYQSCKKRLFTGPNATTGGGGGRGVKGTGKCLYFVKPINPVKRDCSLVQMPQPVGEGVKGIGKCLYFVKPINPVKMKLFTTCGGSRRRDPAKQIGLSQFVKEHSTLGLRVLQKFTTYVSVIIVANNSLMMTF